MENKLFSIELNNPKYVFPKGKDHNLKTIFTTCFDFPSDDFEIKWNGMSVRLSYRYDVPHLLYPIFDMLKVLCEQNEGKDSVSFGMDSLNAKWNFSWNEKKLNIHSNWNDAPQDLTPELNEKSNLEMSTSTFISEWMKLILFIDTILEKSHIQIQDTYYTKAFFGDLKNLMAFKIEKSH